MKKVLIMVAAIMLVCSACKDNPAGIEGIDGWDGVYRVETYYSITDETIVSGGDAMKFMGCDFKGKYDIGHFAGVGTLNSSSGVSYDTLEIYKSDGNLTGKITSSLHKTNGKTVRSVIEFKGYRL